MSPQLVLDIIFHMMTSIQFYNLFLKFSNTRRIISDRIFEIVSQIEIFSWSIAFVLVTKLYILNTPRENTHRVPVRGNDQAKTSHRSICLNIREINISKIFQIFSETQLKRFYIANNYRYFQAIDIKIEWKNIIFLLFNNIK